MDLSQITYRLSFINDVCLSARMQERFAGCGVINRFLPHADTIEKFLHHAFHRIKITFAVHTKGKLHSFVRQFLQGQFIRLVDIPQLIKPHFFISSIIIGRQAGQHSIQGNRPHNGKVFP